MTYKKILGVFILIALVSPTIISAKNEDAGSNKRVGYCERISSIQTGINKNTGNHGQKLAQKRQEINNRLNEKRTELEKKRDQRRDKWDVNREEHFTKLQERAQNDEQKQAVSNFVNKVQSAISVRRGLIEKAISDYHDALDDLKESREATIDSLTDNYEQGVRAIIEIAKNDCENGTDPQIVGKNLRTELKTIKNAFISSKKGLGNDREKIQEIIEIKKEAIQEAVNEFKTEVQSALAELKEALE